MRPTRLWLMMIVTGVLLLSALPTLAALPAQEATPTPTAFVPPTVQQPPTATPRPTATPMPNTLLMPTPRPRVSLPTAESVRAAALRGALIAVAAYGVGFLYVLIRAGFRALLRLRQRRLNRQRRLREDVSTRLKS